MMRRFSPGHEDLVHDLAYDFYGRRLATCSSDQRIKVWDRQKPVVQDETQQMAAVPGLPVSQEQESQQTTDDTMNEWNLSDSWKVDFFTTIEKMKPKLNRGV